MSLFNDKTYFACVFCMRTNSCLSCFSVLAHGFMMRSVRYYSISLISHPDLWLSKPKGRSGQVGEFNFSDWLGCDLPENAMMHEIFSLQSLQFCSKNIFVEKVVFHLNIACKTLFLSYLKKCFEISSWLCI